MSSGIDRERDWLEREVRLAASLSDADRIRIVEDLFQTVEMIRRTKTPEELRREEEVRRLLEDVPVRVSLIALSERLE